MFYPEDSLKKGGRFYLCWVADSWPVYFATITPRQLWSQDIRKICDDLLQVMNNESGRPANRFSLRLSSQLMRGLVRLYQKKVNMMLSELCMIAAKVMKHSNKKFNINNTIEDVERHLLPLLELQAPVRETVPEMEERVEEMIQQSGNAVTNIENITLREAAIPEFQLPPNDGFGEENPNQALQLLQDRTLEEMLGGAGAAPRAPRTPAPARTPAPSDRTRDASRLAVEPSMERISEHDITLFRKSTVQDILPEETDKEIPIPEIPPPDVPAPIEKEPLMPAPEAVAPGPAHAAPQEPEIVILETLEEGEPQAKRRRKNKLIIDKNNQISNKFFLSRIENINVDLRCEEFSDDIADLRVPAPALLARPARAAGRLARALLRLYCRNLGAPHPARPDAHTEMELALAAHARRATVPPALEPIPEEQQPGQPQEPPIQELQLPIDETVLNKSTAVPDLSATVEVEMDISTMPTQKLDTASQKRTSQEVLNTIETKRRRFGVPSCSQFQNVEPQEQELDEKENIPDNRQTLPLRRKEAQPPMPLIEIQRPSDQERVLSSMLQEAGLADIQFPAQPAEAEARGRGARRAGSAEAEARGRGARGAGSGSGGSETPQGSPDRTKVSLGDSDRTTDSKRFIRDQWGTEGTMVKILKLVKAEVRPLDVDSLVALGPVVPGYRRIIAARCFASILKLKQGGFIKVRKDPATLEILDMYLGPKFDIN